MVIRTSRPYKYKDFVLIYIIRCSIPGSIPVHGHVGNFRWSIHSHDVFHRFGESVKEASALAIKSEAFTPIRYRPGGEGREGSVEGLRVLAVRIDGKSGDTDIIQQFVLLDQVFGDLFFCPSLIL